MRIVVTGATSLIGLAVTKELLDKEHEVFAVARPDSPGRRRPEGKEGCFIMSYTLREIHTLMGRRELAGRTDTWPHLGWEGAGSDNHHNPGIQARNIAYALEALKTAYALRCSHFLFSGSQAEYGICHMVMREDEEYRPVPGYDRDKLKVCSTASEGAHRLGITCIRIRVFSVYGPGDHPWSLVAACMGTFLKGGHMELGAHTQIWNFLYITDVARALTGLLLTKAPVGAYSMAGEDTRPLKHYLEELCRLCGGGGTYEYGKRPPNARRVVSLIPDTGKLHEAVGFRQGISFERGIKEMLHRGNIPYQKSLELE